MSVLIVAASLMTSYRARHQAKYVGQGNWVASWLPRPTLTYEQAVGAMRAAEEVSPVVAVVERWSGELGLSPLEALGMAAMDCTWPQPPPMQRPCRRRGRFR